MRGTEVLASLPEQGLRQELRDVNRFERVNEVLMLATLAGSIGLIGSSFLAGSSLGEKASRVAIATVAFSIVFALQCLLSERNYKKRVDIETILAQNGHHPYEE